MPKAKKKTLKMHAGKRLFERYGIPMTQHFSETVLSQIRKGYSRIIEKQSNRVSVHIVEYEGRDIKAVYDKIRKCLVTVLPLEDK